MAVLSQSAADALIDKIDKAILKHSVSNRDVAAVLGFLNYILKSGESDKFLRKDVEDTAAGLIHFLKGIDVKDMVRTEGLHVAGNSSFDGYLASKKFVSGFPEGSGWALFVKEVLNAAGVAEEHASLEINDLTVRGRFRVYEMIISQLLGENGTRLTTDMMKVAQVDLENKKILLDTEKGVLYNPFRPGDIIMVQHYGTAGALEKRYEFNVVDVGCGTGDSEERLDWLTYENFVGDEADIAPGDTFVRVDSLTDPDRKGIIKHTSVEPGSPYIDIITGMKTDPENSVRTRFGRLEGLITPQFGQLSGYGIYCDNIYACGIFRLKNGEDVQTKFEILEGKISSEIHAVFDKFTQEDNFLRNTTFSNNMQYWECETDIITYKIGTEPLMLNGFLFTEKKKVAALIETDHRLVLHLRNSYIKQYNKDLFRPEPDRILYLTIKYLCREPGVLSLGFEGQELFCEETIEPTTVYVEKVMSAPWDGSGDFLLRFTGDIYISVLTLSYNSLQDFIVDTTTRFEQTAEQISSIAESVHTLHGSLQEHIGSFHVTSEKIDAMVQRTSTLNDEIEGINKTISTSGWITTADGNNLWATIETVDNIGNLVTEHESELNVVANSISAIVKSVGENAQGIQELRAAGFITTADGNRLWASKDLADGSKIISYINQTAEQVTINADKINLRGAVSFDDFDSTVISDGKIKTELLDVDSILARQAKIGDFKIQGGSIFSEDNAYSYLNSKFFMYAHGSSFLGFSSKNAWVGIGLNTMPVSGGWQALGRFESTETDNWGVKLGLYINVGNSTYGRNYGLYSLQACISKEAFISLGCKKVYLTDTNTYNMDLGRYSKFVFSSSKSYNVILPSKSTILHMFNVSMFPPDWGFRFMIHLDIDCAKLYIKPPNDGSMGLTNWNASSINSIEMSEGDTIELLVFENYYRIIQHCN
ncbi:methyl-accepting chemotaxis protein [Parabacteroides goldsteinii]|uniref:methyl-accepting chemotaxis protein n=2 Tax=Parabacteroides TaxID=375288 RepID=UPI0025712F81|nr:methyl-accepting chemotaxis protein [Parabacteroides goldsteinii]